MENKETLENSLFETIIDNSIELSGEIAEYTIDQFISDDFLKEIPFFSVFYKSLKTVSGIREAIFVMKVYKFMNELHTIKEKEKQNFVQKITTDKKERVKIGQTLILILEKIDDLDKTSILANLFAAYLEQKLTKSEFIHLCSIVQNSFIENLRIFFQSKDYRNLSHDAQNMLSSVGLLSPLIIDTKSMYGENVIIDKNNYHLVYVITKIGSKMKQFGYGNLPSI